MSNLEISNGTKELAERVYSERKQVLVATAEIDTVDFNDETIEITIKDELGGIHSEGIGWYPDGTWCGECNKITCVGCSNVVAVWQ